MEPRRSGLVEPRVSRRFSTRRRVGPARGDTKEQEYGSNPKSKLVLPPHTPKNHPIPPSLTPTPFPPINPFHAFQPPPQCAPVPMRDCPRPRLVRRTTQRAPVLVRDNPMRLSLSATDPSCLCAPVLAGDENPGTPRPMEQTAKIDKQPVLPNPRARLSSREMRK